MIRDVINGVGSDTAAPSSMVSRGGIFVQRPYFPATLIRGRYDLDRENTGHELIEITEIYEKRPKLIEEAEIEEEVTKTLMDSTPAVKPQVFKVQTVFPFILFPDELIVEETKVTIIKRYFFASEEIHTIPIKDIVDVIVSCSLFFASIYIKRAFQNDLYQFNYIKRQEAFKVRQMIQDLAAKLGEKKG